VRGAVTVLSVLTVVISVLVVCFAVFLDLSKRNSGRGILYW
jgi:hypothetical protein